MMDGLVVLYKAMRGSLHILLLLFPHTSIAASDGTGHRKVLSDSTAGSVPKSEVIPGYTIRISTGAPVPDGADAVVQVEDTELIKEADGVRPAVLEFSTFS